MKTVAVIGTQWGDEGKGKITDFLSEQADVVVRYQGGNNAGHSIKINDQKFALHLIPSGILRNTTQNVLGNGMVIDIEGLVKEINGLKALNIDTHSLHISTAAHVILPYHRDLDHLLESLQTKEKVGTTAKGIGPAYMMKASRFGLRMIDFIHPNRFKTYLEGIIPIINKILKSSDLPVYDSSIIYEKYLHYAKIIKPYVKNTSIYLDQALNANKKILFEGAQGTMLCLDHGTYPFVTSSSPTAASIALNLGIPPQSVKRVVGVTKAYTTRVGSGYFATEIIGEIANHIRLKGNEFGTTTNRPRRIGWIDTVILKQAKRLNGLTDLAITLLDVLQGINPLKICIGYHYLGDIIDEIPASIEDYQHCQPIYLEMEGFTEDISTIKDYKKLPINAQLYLKKIEELSHVKISIISVGPSRDQTIVGKSFLKKLYYK